MPNKVYNGIPSLGLYFERSKVRQLTFERVTDTNKRANGVDYEIKDGNGKSVARSEIQHFDDQKIVLWDPEVEEIIFYFANLYERTYPEVGKITIACTYPEPNREPPESS